MKRIVIQLSELSHENWTNIYRFIERCFGNKQYSKLDFVSMKNNSISIGIDENPNNCDVCSIAEEGIIELQYESLPEKGDYIFNIIYVKTDEREEFSDFTRFFLLKKKYAGRITMGINVDVLSKSGYNDYKFQLGIFLFFIKNKTPQLGRNSLYLISTISGKPKAIGIPYMDEGTDPNYEKASPFLFPLIPININNFGVFENTDSKKNEVEIYIEHSLENIKKRLGKEKKQNVDLEGCHTLFEKWLVSSFYLSIDKKNLERFIEWKPVLLEYCRNIFELTQNILFHTAEKQGLFYVVINKREKVSKTLQTFVSDYEKFDESVRFLEFGIFDYGNKGIVRTFIEKEGILFHDYNLSDFYKLDKQNIIYGSSVSLHLGIKLFVNSIKDHKGYFRVESNNLDNTKDIVENTGGKIIVERNSIDNVCGTHYDVVLPIIDFREAGFEQLGEAKLRGCLRDKIIDYEMQFPKIPMKALDDLKGLANLTINGKDYQESTIKKVANKILEEASNCKGERVAIDFKEVEIRSNILYKLIDKLFESNNKEKKIGNNSIIVFANLEGDSIDKVCERFLSDIKLYNKRRFPIVLIGKKWKIQILYGKNRKELLYANKRLHSLFFSVDYFGQVKSYNYKYNDKEKLGVEKVIFPYDLMIENEKCETLFDSFVHEVLETPIESDNSIGCKVKFPTKIGSKLYVSNYYEADFLFHNNFFTDRFAYFIAREIVGKIKDKNRDFDGKKLVMIGYNPYSSPMAERVKEYVNDYYNKEIITDIVIAKEKDREKGLEFKLSNDKIEEFLKDFNNYSFITIVPIASTLSTTDKIIALFNKVVEKQFNHQFYHAEEGNLPIHDYTELPHNKFVYNYVTILVRDKKRQFPTKNEKSKRWTEINNHTINTEYQGIGKEHKGMKVDFLIQKASDENNSSLEISNWHNLIDNDTFPNNWWEEKYINQTKNASINTKEMHGIPIAALPSMEEMRTEISFEENLDESITENDVLKKYYDISEKKLKEMREYIYFGHLEHGRSHHRYYFDIERLFYYFSPANVHSSKHQNELSKENLPFQHLSYWLEFLGKQFEKTPNSLYIIITPDYDYESCYVNTINEKVFNNNAYVVYININDTLQNNKFKLSYLKDIRNYQKPRYYFVDQVLLTGDTYNKTKSYMASVLGDNNFEFDGIISVINRLSKDKYKEILNGLRHIGQFFSYLHFFVLPTKEMEKDCSLCGLRDLYDNLYKYSAIGNCRNEIEKNRQKFESKEYNYYFAEGLDHKHENYSEKGSIQKVADNNRYWLRMKWRHQLFFELTKDNAIEDFDKVFDELYNSCHAIDDKISFFKAVTFPPLSQYVKIREYAHRLQLKQLHDLFNDKSQHDFEGFCLLMVLLKHLAFLGSNALVRREVIVKSWELYFYVYEHEKDKQHFITKKNFKQKFLFYIKLASYKDEAKSLWLGELLRCGEEMPIKKFRNEYKAKKTIIYNRLFHEFDKTKYATEFEDFLPLKEFKDFLPLAFYDNTAITHKTLDNFEFAIDKDNRLKGMLKLVDGDNRWRLKDFSDVSIIIDDIVGEYKKKVNQEYYYAWFRHFLNAENKTPDGVPILEKFVYVLYEKLLLKDLGDAKTKNTKPFDNNAEDILEVAAKVMNADAAFITIKRENSKTPYVLACYNTLISESEAGNYYGNKLLHEEIDQKKGLPFVISKDLSQYKDGSREKEGFNRSTYLMLNRENSKDGNINKNTSLLIGVVTFLYKDEDLKKAKDDWENEKDESRKKIAGYKVTDTHDWFMKNTQESGRLLLLLKTQMDDYVKHVDDEKQFDLWKKEKAKEEDFIRVNVGENHQLNLKKWTFRDGKESDEDKAIRARSWFMLSDTITKHLFAQLLQFNEIHPFDPNVISHSLNELFDDKFKKLLYLLHDYIWKGSSLSKTNFDISIDKERINNAKEIYGEIPVYQSFIIQSMSNAFKHQPKPINIERNVRINVYVDDHNNGIVEIKNSLDIVESDLNEWIIKKEQFMNDYNTDHIMSLRYNELRRYRFTLVSLLKYLDAINTNNDHDGLHLNYRCEFDFNLEEKPYYFAIRILFNS